MEQSKREREEKVQWRKVNGNRSRSFWSSSFFFLLDWWGRGGKGRVCRIGLDFGESHPGERRIEHVMSVV